MNKGWWIAIGILGFTLICLLVRRDIIRRARKRAIEGDVAERNSNILTNLCGAKLWVVIRQRGDKLSDFEGKVTDALLFHPAKLRALSREEQRQILQGDYSGVSPGNFVVTGIAVPLSQGGYATGRVQLDMRVVSWQGYILGTIGGRYSEKDAVEVILLQVATAISRSKAEAHTSRKDSDPEPPWAA